MSRGRALELYFVDGRPDGMLTAEIFNWTGHVLSAPRTQLALAQKRETSRRTGVYLLIGEGERGPRVYVGEGEDVADRLRQHQSKDWWDRVVIVTAADDALHKAHVKYLESRLVEIAKAAGRAALENGNTPPRSSLSEAGQASMEEFIDTLSIVLPAIDVPIFDPARRTPQSPKDVGDEDGAVFRLQNRPADVTAQARVAAGDFVVLAGSEAANRWRGVEDHHYARLYDSLVERGVLIDKGNKRIFSVDYAFSSPSAAAAVVTARAANGRVEWKLPDGTSYGDWEEAISVSIISEGKD